MDYILESVPAREYYRFKSLSVSRQYSIIGSEWLVDETKETFLINTGLKENAPAWVRNDESIPWHYYYLLGYDCVLYGLETKQKDSRFHGSEVDVIFAPAIFYVQEQHQPISNSIVENARVLLLEYQKMKNAILRERLKNDPVFKNQHLEEKVVREVVFNELSFIYFDQNQASRLL